MSSEPMNSDVAVRANRVGKRYEIYSRPVGRLMQAMMRGRRQYFTEYWALRDVSFEVKRGEALGIVGQNGSGKSTLLQIIAGTLRPSEGEVELRGRVAALLELGSGFNYEFTGKENVYLNGAILGLSHKAIDERYDDIAAFADIGSYIDQPVKTFSTGMVMRLAFAVQVQVEPDILIVDEALAVGDTLFQKRCYDKMEALRSEGVTLLFVSHEQETIRTLTSKALLLDRGQVVSYGPSAETILDYRELLHEAETQYFTSLLDATQKPKAQKEERSSDKSQPSVSESGEGDRSKRMSFGSLDAEIQSVEVFNAAGETGSVFYPGERMSIRVTAIIHKAMRGLNIGLRIRSKQGIKAYSWGTFNQDQDIRRGAMEGEALCERQIAAGETIAVDFEFECALGMDLYEIQALVAEETQSSYGGQRMLHWRDEAAYFQVMVDKRKHFFGGICDMKMRAHVRK